MVILHIKTIPIYIHVQKNTVISKKIFHSQTNYYFFSTFIFQVTVNIFNICEMTLIVKSKYWCYVIAEKW